MLHFIMSGIQELSRIYTKDSMVPERCSGPQKENPTVQSDTSIHNHTMSPQIHLDKYLYKDF